MEMWDTVMLSDTYNSYGLIGSDLDIERVNTYMYNSYGLIGSDLDSRTLNV